VSFTRGLTLHDALPHLETSTRMTDNPSTFEDLDQDYRLILYQNLTAGGTLMIPHVHDRVHVFVDSV